jgi:putative peptidoglycan lipid II flippase
LILLDKPIIRLIFERGAFTATDTLATAQALSLYAIGLFAYSANKILVPVFYALDDTKFPVIASFLSVVTNIAIISSTISAFQHRAIALSVSCSAIFSLIFLSLVLYKKLNGYSVDYLAKGILKICLATLVMSSLILGVRTYFSAWLDGNIYERAISLLSLIGASGLLYGLTLYMLGLHELTDIISKIKTRVFS